MQGTRFPDQVRLSDLRPGSYDFLLTVTDSNGQSEDAEVSVLVLGPEESSCEYTHTQWVRTSAQDATAVQYLEVCHEAKEKQLKHNKTRS